LRDPALLGLDRPLTISIRSLELFDQLLEGGDRGLQRCDPIVAGGVNVRLGFSSLHFAYSTPPGVKSTRAAEL
jgi:hypothetical protein